MKILVPLDVSGQSESALAFLARRPQFTQDSEVSLLTVHQTIRPSLMRVIAKEDIERIQKATADEIFARAKPYFNALGQTPKMLTAEGDPTAKILETAKNLPADLIVMGAHGERTLGDILLGSVSRGVLSKSTCPVVLLRKQLPPAGRPMKIVVPVDSQEVTCHAVDWILENRHLFSPQTDFRLVHSVPSSTLEVLPRFTAPTHALEEQPTHAPRNAEWHQAVDPVAQRFAEAGLTSRNIALTGRASQAIADYVTKEEIDFIIIGSHARGELKALFLGSVAAEVMTLTQVPMLIVR